jgi:hypothetical protein
MIFCILDILKTVVFLCVQSCMFEVLKPRVLCILKDFEAQGFLCVQSCMCEILKAVVLCVLLVHKSKFVPSISCPVCMLICSCVNNIMHACVDISIHT